MLDGPPPAPGNSPAPGPAGFGGMAPPMGGGLPSGAIEAVAQQCAAIKDAVLGLAQSVPMSAPQCSQIVMLLEQIATTFVEASAGAISPTNTGSQFPGGGFSAGMP